MTGRPSAEESARLLRQRLEMGDHELFLEGMSREEAIRLLRTAHDAAPGSSPGPQSRAEADEARRAPARAEPGAERAPRARAPGASAAPPAPSGAAAAAPPLELPDDYEALRELALGCTRCKLCEGRTQVVFSDGSPDARLMVVGEAPGANEDETGLPFVGAAGKYLDLLLATVGLSRADSVYIANVLKCRPPGNRDPLPEEIEACSPYLRKQIELVRPEALLAVGSFAGKLLTGREKSSLGGLRGEVHGYHGVPLVVTYHPAALLRNPRWTRAFWTDLQLLRDVMDDRRSA
jgi:DNA polymerase